MRRIAIRSFNDTAADNVGCRPRRSRVASPRRRGSACAMPSSTACSTSAARSTPRRFNLLANQKDVDPRDPAAAIREEQLPMQGPLEDTAVDTTFAVYEAGRALTYLPDPLASEVAVRVFDHPNIATPRSSASRSTRPATWPEARPFVIEVYDDPSDAAAFRRGDALASASRCRRPSVPGCGCR